MGHYMGLWLGGGGHSYSQAQAEGGQGSLPLDLSAKIAYGNSLSRHGHSHHSTPVTPSAFCQKNISLPFSPHILLSTDKHCVPPPPWIFPSKFIPKSAPIQSQGTFMTRFGVPCARFKTRHPLRVQSQPTQNKSHQDGGLAWNGDSQYRLQEIHKNRKITSFRTPFPVFHLSFTTNTSSSRFRDSTGT